MHKKAWLILLSVFLLSACSSVNTTQTLETRSVETLMGTVEIPTNPTRVVDLSGYSDVLNLLGLPIVGTANSDAYDYTRLPSYLEDSLKGAKILGYSYQDTMDIEAILALDPDLIVISSIQEKMYPQLSELAPTVMIQLEALDWKKDIRTLASLFDREEEANLWLTSYEDLANREGQAIQSQNSDASYLSFLYMAGSFYLFDGAGLGSVLYQDLGLKRPVNLPIQDSVSLPVVSLEGLYDIDADAFIILATQEDYDALSQEQLWLALKAVKNNKVKLLSASPYFSQGYSALGRALLLSELKGLLSFE